MNIVVTGAGGQLGKTFADMASEYGAYNWVFLDRSGLDITDPSAIKRVLNHHNTDIVINTAAYTAVDAAEDDVETCTQVNVHGVDNLARYCADRDCFLVHYSTDYVYHQDTGIPLKEDSHLAPQSVYAHNKVDGERAILLSGCRSLILRTSWVYSEYGNNFVKTMLRLAETRDSLRIVNDQIGAPTYTRDIVRATMSLLDSPDIRNSQDAKVLNYSNEGQISWYDFAREIFIQRGIDIEVSPIPSVEYPTPASRPQWSVLDMTAVRSYGIETVGWKESLTECLGNL